MRPRLALVGPGSVHEIAGAGCPPAGGAATLSPATRPDGLLDSLEPCGELGQLHQQGPFERLLGGLDRSLLLPHEQ